MQDLELVQLSDIPEEQIIALMSNERVGRQLPLLTGGFSTDDCQAFLAEKKRLWDEHGFGPWAFLIGGEFAGWGGLQAERGDVDFALVLHPTFWGWGRTIFNRIKDQAFEQMSLDSITILFPPSRKNARAIARLGFIDDGQLTVDGRRFLRFRLNKNS